MVFACDVTRSEESIEWFVCVVCVVLCCGAVRCGGAVEASWILVGLSPLPPLEVGDHQTHQSPIAQLLNPSRSVLPVIGIVGKSGVEALTS